MRRSVRPTFALSLALVASASLPTGVAHAGTALYHLRLLDVAGATGVTVKDINDAGQAVGVWNDQDFVGHAVLWDADGTAHDLALPPGDEVNGIATAINASGRIVGSSNDFVVPAVGLVWDAATPGSYVAIDPGTDAPVSPLDVNDAGVVVGGFGAPMRAFVWTAADGFVDYGLQDPTLEDQQARWFSINAAGTLVGSWNQHVSNIHATVGIVGTPAVLSMSAATEATATIAVAVNDAGTAVGLALDPQTAKLVPAQFDIDGAISLIPGAVLDQDNGSATAINASGVVVGNAGIGTANGAVPGLKTWVYRDGEVHDLYESVDDTGVFVRFASAAAVNAHGLIVGSGRDADGAIRSFVLTPIGSDAIFADGFDG